MMKYFLVHQFMIVANRECERYDVIGTRGNDDIYRHIRNLEVFPECIHGVYPMKKDMAYKMMREYNKKWFDDHRLLIKPGEYEMYMRGD